MPKHVTAVVVGGGPAGSSAAYTLARHGIEVCVIDKSAFPRDKLCGGLLTLRCRKVFDEVFDAPWHDTFNFESRGVSFHHKYQVLKTVEDYTHLYLTHRVDFDHHLLQLAITKGATARLGDGLSSVDTDRRVCTLKSGDTISYDYLIGADGVNSVVARALTGEPPAKKHLALALEIEVPRSDDNEALQAPEIHFGVVRWGYGWVFPKRDTLTVGIGGAFTKNPRMKEDFTAFLENRFGTVPDIRVKGHHLPIAYYRKKPGKERVLLAGDAAGLVEPITGEGIAFAIQSGHLAAQAVVDALRSHRADALAMYMKRYASIDDEMKRACRLTYLVYPRLCTQQLIKALPRSTTLALRHLDLMAADIGYAEYSRHIRRGVIRTLARRALFMR